MELTPTTITTSSNLRLDQQGDDQRSSPRRGAGGGEAEERQVAATELSTVEQAEVRRLEQRDQEVRAHERAHINAGGSVVRGGASFTYAKGPDGERYAVGGEVPISITGGSTSEESLRNAETVQRAALAPVSPSSADRAIATKAAQMAAQARVEIARNGREAEGSEHPRPSVAVTAYLHQDEAYAAAMPGVDETV